MVGLAVEESVRVAHEALCHLEQIKARARPHAKARDLLAELKKASDGWPNQKEDRHRFSMAVVAAEGIRVERNRASHAGVALGADAGVEELLIIASGVIAVFWQLPCQAGR